MLRLLLRLWWLQQRRNFHWRDAFVGGYVVLIYVVMGVGFYTSFTEHGGDLTGMEASTALTFVLVMVSLLPDIILKAVMKRDITAIDDYVKSRPVPEKVWNRFLLATNLVSFWNYVLPVLMLPVFILLMPVGQAIASFLLLLAFSYIDGIYITCYRKASDRMLKWPLALGWMAMLVVLTEYVFISSFFPAWMAWTGMLLLAVAVFAGLVLYLYNLKEYNEQRRKVSRLRGFRHISLFSLQYIGTLRAKRIRNMVLLITAIFLFDAYMFALLPSDASEDIMGQQATVTMYAAGAILLPSVVLSQCTFGVEANFFQGLLTKPVRVEEMLRNCFYHYLVVSFVTMLLVVPFLFLDTGVGMMVLVGGFCLAVFINLFNLPTCLFTSRLEIFNASLFSMQGANLKINLYSAAFLLPLAIVAGVYWQWGEMAWACTCIALALLSLAIHKWFISKIAAVFYKNRYKRMEKFMEK